MKILLITLMVMCGLPMTANAFTCGKPTIKESFGKSDLIFKGKMLSVEGQGAQQIVTFSVEKVFKGDVTSEEVKLRPVFVHFGEKALKKYKKKSILIYSYKSARDPDGLYRFGPCSRTRVLKTEVELIREIQEKNISSKHQRVFIGKVEDKVLSKSGGKKNNPQLVLVEVDRIILKEYLDIEEGQVIKVRSYCSHHDFDEGERYLFYLDYSEKRGLNVICGRTISLSEFEILIKLNKLKER